MEITNRKINLLRLWAESFSVVNRSTGKLIAAVLCSVLLVALVAAVLVFGVGATTLLAKLQMATLSKTVGVTTFLFYMASALLANLYGIFFLTVCWQIVSAEALGLKRPLSEFFAGSVLPTLYQVVAAILLAIPYMLVVAALAFTKSAVVMGLGMLLVFLVAVRICYSFIAMAVDNRGPIEGLQLSWKMTAGKGYHDALLMCVMLVVSVLLLEGLFLAIGYAFYVTIPLHFAQGFSLAHLSFIWWLVGFVLLMLGLFIYFAFLTFPVLVFWNRKAQEDTLPGAAATEGNVFIPLPELEIPDNNPAQKIESASTTQPEPVLPMNPEPEVVPQAPAVQPAPVEKPIPVPPPPPAPSLVDGLEELQVTQSSVHAGEEDVNEITQHLDKVYTPKPEDFIQYGDEDRMPTILFDDEMAKQLQEQGIVPPESNSTTQNPPDDGPIKMSK